MKKKVVLKVIIIIACIVFCVGAGVGAYVGGRAWTNTLPLEKDYNDVYQNSNFYLEIDASGVFNVLKINDTHFINGETEDDIKTLNGIERELSHNQYDLVILGGDIVDGFNFNVKYDKEKSLKKLAETLESFDVAWTFIAGNNDGEIDGDNRDVITYLLKYPNFIMGNVRGLSGDTQFFIDLTLNGEVKHSLAFLDSGARKPSITGRYESIDEDITAWLVENASKRDNKVSVFFHMPSPIFKEAYQQGTRFEGIPQSNLNDYASIKGNASFDDKVMAVENIKCLSVAHQHGNSMCALYKDKYFELSSPSGYSASMPSTLKPSVTRITINTLACDTADTYFFERIYY